MVQTNLVTVVEQAVVAVVVMVVVHWAFVMVIQVRWQELLVKATETQLEHCQVLKLVQPVLLQQV
jgi:hypothetical protein